MLKIKNLVVSYGEKQVLKGVNLTLKSGEITAILGESGAGKTTLLNAVAGLKDYGGEIVKNTDKVSFVFQTPCLLENATVCKNLNFAVDGLTKNDISSALQSLNLAGYENRIVNTLSGGEKQRVSLARAFLSNAPLMLFDEPFSSLDMGLRLKSIMLVKNLLVSQNKSVLFVTHDVDETVLLADNAVLIKNGVISKEVNLKTVKDKKQKIYEMLEIF